MKKFECIRLQIRVFILSSLNFIGCFIVNLKKDSSLIRCLAIFTQKQLQIEWEVYQKLYYAGLLQRMLGFLEDFFLNFYN